MVQQDDEKTDWSPNSGLLSAKCLMLQSLQFGLALLNWVSQQQLNLEA
jgi:hypothetical protein